MKKIFSLAVLVAALMFAGTAKAQYGRCNAQYQNGIPQQPLTMAVVIDATNYTPQNPAEVRPIIISATNEAIATQYPSSKLTFTEDESDNFNIQVILHITATNPGDNSDSYKIVAEVRGLGVGHLFTIVEPVGTAVDSTYDVVQKLPRYFVNGWHANDGSACQ